MSKLLEGLPESGLITVEEEERMTRDGEMANLVLHFVREAFAYAKTCCRGALEDDELLSLAYLALHQASENYDIKKSGGVRFFGYAKPYIRGQIHREWKKKDVVRNASSHETIPLSEAQQPSYQGFEDYYRDGYADWTPPVVASIEKVALTPTTCEIDFESMDTRDRVEILKPIIKERLKPAEQMVVTLRVIHGFYFDEIGKLRGISRQAARMTFFKAMRKIRSALIVKKAL